MKEHFQDYGVRKWAGDDLIELQSEPLAALQALVSPYAPCIVSGCEVHSNDEGGYTVSAGLVALTGKDAKGKDCVKIVRAAGITLADNKQVCYLTLSHQALTRTYMDGQSKAIAYDYVAQQTTIQPQDVPYLEISVNGGRRLVDTIGITQKLNSEGGDATNVEVNFVEPSAEQMPGILTSGTKLGVLISQIKGWLNRKVDIKKDYGLSKNDFTDELKTKLEGIDKEANKYTHPAGDGNNHIPTGGESGKFLKWSSSGTATWAKPTASDCGAASTSEATQSAKGLMSANDKKKLDNIAEKANNFTYTHPTHTAKSSGLYKITVDSSGHVSATTAVTKADITTLNIPAQDTVYVHPTGNGNNHIPKGGASGQYLKYSMAGTAFWASHFNFQGKISGALSLRPGMIGNLSADATIIVSSTDEDQLKTNPIAYVGNSGYKKLTLSKLGVTLVHSNSTKGKSGVAATGLWKFTWVATDAVFVEFFGCDSYT